MASGPVGLWVDWNNDGFGTGAHDDLTQLVTHATYSRGSSPEITGAAQAGQAVFTVQNPGGLFNPDNAAGALYGLLRDGAPVWWGMREDGTIAGSSTATVRGRFAGRVVEVVPLPQPGAGSSTPLAQIICEDPLALYGRIPVKLSDDCSALTPVAAQANMCGPYSAYTEATPVPVYWQSAGDIGCGIGITSSLIKYLGSIGVFAGWRFLGRGTISFHAECRSVPGQCGAGTNRTFRALLNGSTVIGSVTHSTNPISPADIWMFDVTDQAVAPGDEITFSWNSEAGCSRAVLNNATVQPTYITGGLLA